LTPGERERGRWRRKPYKPKSKKPELEPIVPLGIVAEILNVISSKDKSKLEEMGTKLNHEFNLMRESRPQDSAEFVNDLNQFVDHQNSTILHIAVKNDVQDLVW